MNHAIISVIVPVYNSEKFLKTCVDSIRQQSYQNIEIILVNDGSIDSSGKICDEFQCIDSRIITYHINNNGAAAARNFGIEKATGKYLMFCDSDDIVAPDWVKDNYNYAKDDIQPFCSFCDNLANIGTECKLNIESKKIYDYNQLFNFKKSGIAGYITNTIFNKSIIDIHNIKFRCNKAAGDYNEDLLFATEYFNYINKIVYVGKSNYYYNHHNDSLSNSFNKYYFPKYIEKYEIWLKWINNNAENITEKITDLSTEHLFHIIIALINATSFSISSLKQINSILHNNNVQMCAEYADGKNENPIIIKSIINKNVLAIWSIFIYQKIKRMINNENYRNDTCKK